MAHVIEAECVSCAMCVAVCPENCIVESDTQFLIDAERCTDCAACQPACPIDCVVGTPAHP
jgi:formate hydrogenlyase subunit 6/NADH:ubiquinone oxidoreductase subunit I